MLPANFREHAVEDFEIVAGFLPEDNLSLRADDNALIDRLDNATISLAAQK